MEEQGPEFAVQQNRPITFLILYVVRFASGLSAEGVVMIMPAVCAVGFSLGVFWFVRVGTKNDPLALLSALLTTVSFQTTVSVYTYSVSNWIALLETFIFFGLLLKGFETHHRSSAIAASAVGVVLLLTHLWCWTVMMVVLLLYVAVYAFKFLRKKTDEKSIIKQLVFVFATNLVFCAVYGLLPFGKAVGEAVTGTLPFTLQNLSTFPFVSVYAGLDSAVHLWVGGIYGNAPLLILAILGLFLAKGQSARFGNLLWAWMAAVSSTLLFLSAESYFFYRMMYLVPIQIFAAFGLSWCLSGFDRFSVLNEKRTLRVVFKVLLVILVVLFLLNAALRSVESAPLHLL